MPTRVGADAGFVIMEQVEYPCMSGTSTICVPPVRGQHGAGSRLMDHRP